VRAIIFLARVVVVNGVWPGYGTASGDNLARSLGGREQRTSSAVARTTAVVATVAADHLVSSEW